MSPGENTIQRKHFQLSPRVYRISHKHIQVSLGIYKICHTNFQISPACNSNIIYQLTMTILARTSLKSE